MKIPKNTISPTSLRTYGSGDALPDDHEEDRGCRRRWKAKYVDGVKEEQFSYALAYGSMFHRVMERIVAHDVDPREAVLSAIEPDATVQMVDELLADLEAYLARPSDGFDDMAVLGTEVDLRSPLYDDEEHGEITFRAILDVLAVDPDDPSVIHVKDYKSNRSPISGSDLAGDVQLRGQAWLVRRHASRWTSEPNPRIIMHMDLVKFRDYTYEYSDDELDAWETWAIAIVRAILRDEDATPRLNAYCSSCPVRDDCPALASAPADALALAAKAAFDPKALTAGRMWRDEANRARLALEKVVKAWDLEFEATIGKVGAQVIAGKEYSLVPKDVTFIDVFAIARALGEDFPKVASVSKAAIDRSSLTESQKATALSHFRSEVDGTRLSSRKATS